MQRFVDAIKAQCVLDGENPGEDPLEREQELPVLRLHFRYALEHHDDDAGGHTEQ